MISSRGDFYLEIEDEKWSELGKSNLQAKAKKVYSTVDLFDSLNLRVTNIELTVREAVFFTFR